MHAGLRIASVNLLVTLLAAGLMPTLAAAQIGISVPTEDPASGSIGSQYEGIDFTISGADELEQREPMGSGFTSRFVYGTAAASAVTVECTFKLSTYNAPAEFTAVASAHGCGIDAVGLPIQPKPGYEYQVPAQTWQGQLDGLGREELLTREGSFSFTIPIPAFDLEHGITAVAFDILLTKTVPPYRDAETDSVLGDYQREYRLGGYFRIPDSLKEKPAPQLSMTNGGPLEPLKLRLKLADYAKNPPEPLAGEVIRITAPLPSSPAAIDLSTVNSWNTVAEQVSKLSGPLTVAPTIALPKPDWKLTGCFRSKTKCPNCDWKQATSQFTSDILYYLKKPGEPVEVLTDENGEAEVEFFLDLAALGDDGPLRTNPLKVQIKAEHALEVEGSDEPIRTDSELNIQLKHVGYVTEVSYVQPAKWEWDAVNKKYVPRINPREFPLLGTTEFDKASRAQVSVFNSAIAPTDSEFYGISGSTLELQPPAPFQPLMPGMLLGRGDQIELDARGLLIPHPFANEPQSAFAGINGKPGWVWVGVKFFDGTRGKVGASGTCGTHSLIIGPTPDSSGWAPGVVKFVYWASKQARDAGIANFIPVWGTISDAENVADAISWLNDGWPVYIIVRSQLGLTRQDDGTAKLVVREGYPSVVSQATGPVGTAVAAGMSAEVGKGGAVNTSAATPEELNRVDELVSGAGTLETETSELEPIDLSAALTANPPATESQNDSDSTYGNTETTISGTGVSPFDGFEDMPDDFWAGDVPDYKRFDLGDVTIALEGNWEYTPESDDAYPLFEREEPGLDIMVVREDWGFEECLELLDLGVGRTFDIGAGGKNAYWVQMMEGDKERGCLVYVPEKLSSGRHLILLFISTPELWNIEHVIHVLNLLEF
ncbi:hypothetical protein JW859_10175 [bacterium]|nr:hypothetical protein [bacterium]